MELIRAQHDEELKALKEIANKTKLKLELPKRHESKRKVNPKSVILRNEESELKSKLKQ